MGNLAGHQSRRLKWGVFFLGTAICAALFYWLNTLTPYVMDDFEYMYSWATKERLHSVRGIFPSIVTHYSVMNGRIVPHFILQLLLIFPKGVFNVVNTLMYFALVCLIYLHSCGTFKNFRPGWFFLIQLLLWFFLPKYGQSLLWMAGSATYCYGTVFALCVLLPFRRQGTGISKKQNKAAKACLLFAAGLIAGNCGENIGAALVAFLACDLLRRRWLRSSTRPWMYTGLLGSICGYVVLLAAPGQWKRIDRVNSGAKQGVLRLWLDNLTEIFTTSVEHYLLLSLLIVGAALLLWRLKTAAPQAFSQAAMYAFAGLCSIYVMTPIDLLPSRAFTAMSVFLIIALGRLFCEIPWKMGSALRRGAAFAAAALCCGVFLYSFVPARRQLAALAQQYERREAQALAQVAEGKTKLTLPGIASSSPYSAYSPLADLRERGFIANVGMARYYGAETIAKK